MFKNILYPIVILLLLTTAPISGNEQLERIQFINTKYENDCSIIHFTCISEAMNGRAIKAWVVLPPAYTSETQQTFPVLYALHGRGAPYDTYSKMSRLHEDLIDMPMIIAGFDADEASWYLDSPVVHESQFTTFFFDEFLPAVETQWRVNGERAISGFSMGGFGALHFALTKPDKFSSVSGLSSALQPARLVGESAIRNDFIKLLGHEDPDTSILELANRLEQQILSDNPFPPIYQHCGTEDGLIEFSRDFTKRMVNTNATIMERFYIETSADSIDKKKYSAYATEHTIRFKAIESPGGHDWTFWHSNINGILNFHYRHFLNGQ
ncbi:alpha/beta hydrolase-fold protein [Puniceicoccaceae bacterium K14]|nr:alpha/beta hydrolase-fold protein [Puniceicoccaceae bacterium K14]